MPFDPTTIQSTVCSPRWPPMQVRRPVGITVLAIGYWLVAAFTAGGGLWSLMQQMTTRPAERTDLLLISFIPLMIVPALICMRLGLGLWRLHPTAYWITCMLLIAGIMGTIHLWRAMPVPSTAGLLCCLITLYFLRTKPVRIAFRIT